MRDARRRNRNIGTAKSGRGADNRLRIPERWSDLSVYWQKLTRYVAVEKAVHGRPITFLVEPPRSGYLHHCTVQDVCRVLELLPADHVEPIELIVFRQPTVKQSVLVPVWGRLGYWSSIGPHEGPGVYLEAQPAALVMAWGRSLRPDDMEELDRHRRTGFRVEVHSRGYRIHTTPATMRASLLYRTLPHEVGHYVDYMESQRTFGTGDDWERCWDLYGAKSSRDKEAYAHRYADTFWREQSARQRLPFSPLYDQAAIREDGLEPRWFARVQTES